MTAPSYAEETLPQGIRSRMIHGVNGLDVHVLEAGYATPGQPLVVLLHGFPDLAYGWRGGSRWRSDLSSMPIGTLR